MTEQPEDVVESNCKDIFTRSLIFVCPCLFGIMEHNLMNSLIALQFYLAAPNLWMAVFCMIYNNVENGQSDLPALGF